MTLDQLRIFLEVAARQHVTQAATALNLTQSAVSAAISALENRHGVKLFNRIGRGICLTEDGRAFVPYAHEILQRMDNADRFLNDLRSGVVGTLRLQASQTVASYFLPPFLIGFQTRHPAVSLEFAQGNTRSVIQAVLAGEADIGIVEGHVQDHNLRIRIVGSDRLVLLVGRDHPWADRRPLAPEDLAQAEWVLREAGSGTRAAFDDYLNQLGCVREGLSPLLELPSNEACIAAIETGRGATVLSELAAAPHLAQGLVVEAGHTLPTRSFLLVHHHQRHLGKVARAFGSLLLPPRN